MHNVRVWKLQSQSIVPLLLWVIHPCWSLGSVPTYALLYSADLSVTLMFPVALFVLRHSEFSAAGQKCLVSSKRQQNSSKFLPEYLIRLLMASWACGPVGGRAQASAVLFLPVVERGRDWWGLCHGYCSQGNIFSASDAERLPGVVLWVEIPWKIIFC